MNDKFISIDRKRYLRKIRLNKFAVLITQVGILVCFIAIWEILANIKIIDSFITSQPSRILKTFMNLSSNDLLKHLGVTFYETIIRFSIWNIYWHLYRYYSMAIEIPLESVRTIFSYIK